MAHAIFNDSPLRILSSFQYNNNTTSNKQSIIKHEEKSLVTFQLTVPIEDDNNMSTDIIDIPGVSNHRIQLNDKDLNSIPTDPEDLIQLANSLCQSPNIIPTDELTVCFDGLAVQSPTRQICSPVNDENSRSPSILNTHLFGSPQSYSFLSVGSPQSPFLNATTFFGSPQIYSDVGSPGISYINGMGSPTNRVYNGNVGIPPNQIYSGSSFVSSPSNQVYSGNSFIGSPSASNVQSYVGSPNSTQFLNSPVITATPSDDTGYNTLALSSFLSPITTPSPTNSYMGSSALLFPPNPESTSSRPTSPIPDDAILNTKATHYYQVQPPQLTINTDLTYLSDVVQPIPPQPQQRKIKKSTVKSTTPSGRKAKIHKCPYCQHTSNRANNMREHVQIHNPNRPKPHMCKLCRKPFARKHDMNRHALSCKNLKKKSV